LDEEFNAMARRTFDKPVRYDGSTRFLNFLFWYQWEAIMDEDYEFPEE
jgi:hypothetical protein